MNQDTPSTTLDYFSRPAVIVSGPLHLALPHAVVFVTPVTSRDRGLRHQVSILSQSSGLAKLPSFARPEDTRAVAYKRFGDYDVAALSA
jgi:mRNA-degrading endonuclease toxin of MazEF toxin-antitoxin module